MNPYHHGFLLRAGVVRLPYVQMQAVLALNIEAGLFADFLFLARGLTIIICFIDAIMRCI